MILHELVIGHGFKNQNWVEFPVCIACEILDVLNKPLNLFFFF